MFSDCNKAVKKFSFEFAQMHNNRHSKQSRVQNNDEMFDDDWIFVKTINRSLIMYEVHAGGEDLSKYAVLQNG